MSHLLSAMRAAAETTRLRILAVLARGEFTVGELVLILGQSQPRVSRHLKLMSEASLINRFQEGTVVFYRLADAGVGQQLVSSILPLIESDTEEYQQDLSSLEDIRAERIAKAQAYFRENAASWDELRSLHISDIQVEEALLGLQGRRKIKCMLDVGTGTGRMLELFAPYANQAVGIDLSREMLSIARARLLEKGLENMLVRQGDMYNLGSVPASQDLIIFHQVLHYADDPYSALKEAAGALSDDGCLLIADFAPHHEEFLRTEHAHRRLGFSDEEICQLAEACELRSTAIMHLDGGKLRVTLWRFEK